MQFLLPALYSILFITLILNARFFRAGNVSRSLLALLFLLKLAAAAVVIWVYTSHYSGADFFTYFSDSRALLHNALGAKEAYSQAWTGSFGDALYNGSRTMILLNAALHLFSFGNFYVHVVIFCFFSFVGQAALLKAFLEHFPAKANRLIIALFFVPGILFWGSAALKEPVIIGCTGLLVLLTDFGLKKKYTAAHCFFIVLLMALLLLTRMYVLLALLPLLLANAIVARTSGRLLLLKYAAVFALFLCIALVAGRINRDYSVPQLLHDRQAKAISEAGGGVFLASSAHFIRVDYDRQAETLLPLNDSIFRLVPGSAYTQWPLDDMQDTTFVASASDTSAFRLLYSIRPARSVITLKRTAARWRDLATALPAGLLNALLHPAFSEVTSGFHLLPAIENAAVIMLLLLALLFTDKAAAAKKEILLFCFLFAIIVYMLAGITTPVIGAMVRYKTIGLLLLAPAGLLLISGEKLGRLFKK